MDKMKQWVALTVVGVLAVMAAGWFLLISPKRSEAATIRDKAAAKQVANGALRMQLSMLKAQAKDLPRQQAKLAAVAAKIPDNPALPALIRALTAAAADASVELVSIAPAAPTPYTATGPVGAAASPTVGTPTAAAPAPLQVIGLTVNINGAYFQIEQFFNHLEELTRAMKVTAFTLAPGANPVKPLVSGQSVVADDVSGKTLTGSITAEVFMQNAAAAAPTTVTAPKGAAPATTSR